MIRGFQKSPEVSSQNTRKILKLRLTFFRLLTKRYLHFIETLQHRFHEILIKHISEERKFLHESRSKAIIDRRPGISEESLALARKKKENPVRGKPILIVDDEKNIRLTLSIFLEALGVEIDSAGDGEEALAKLKEKVFGLILLDLHMPGVDGMEVLRQVREIRPDVRVIIITAYGTIERAVEAMKLGAVDFIQKPFLPEEIQERVARVINRGNNQYGKSERNDTPTLKKHSSLHLKG